MNVKEAGLTHISGPLGDCLKEVARRVELRDRLEVEYGRALNDEEFLTIAEKSGLKF